MDPNDDPPSSIVTAFAKTEHGTPTIHGIQFNVPITSTNYVGPDDNYYDDTITISVQGLVPGENVTRSFTAKFKIENGVVSADTNVTYQLN